MENVETANTLNSEQFISAQNNLFYEPRPPCCTIINHPCQGDDKRNKYLHNATCKKQKYQGHNPQAFTAERVPGYLYPRAHTPTKKGGLTVQYVFWRRMSKLLPSYLSLPGARIQLGEGGGCRSSQSAEPTIGTSGKKPAKKTLGRIAR